MKNPPPERCLRGTRKKTMASFPTCTVLVTTFVYIFVSGVPFSCTAQQPPGVDGLILLQFKQGLTADPTEALKYSWTVNSLDAKGCPRNWFGVNCSTQGSVSSLILEQLGLEGEVVSGTLGRLAGLQHLSLSNNSFAGSLPNDLGNLSRLTYMNLSHNLFVGAIPSSVVKLPSLTNLSLAGNLLTGPMPTELSPSLQELDLSGNKLEGQLPATLAQLTQLVRLRLQGNQLSGTVDPTFLALNKTKFVDLSANSFTGPCPWPPSLSAGLVEHVNISHNQFTGSLSVGGILFATGLNVLDISYNQLVGELPSFQYATALTTLRLSANALSGLIPATLLSAPSALVDLDLSSNQLTGPVSTISSAYLKALNLSRNLLSGSLPTWLGPCQSVDLSHNNFSGDLSTMEKWGPSLKRLDLSVNRFSGALSSTHLSQIYQLTSLNLSHNRVSGVVPQPFGTSEVISTIDLSFNQMNGGIPLSFFYSSSVTALLLSHNQFTGTIPIQDSSSTSSSEVGVDTLPVQVSSVSPLLVLDLAGNNLSGSIPGKLGSFFTLEVLDLSANALSGQIPSQLNNLTSLQALDLSQNQLSGSLTLQQRPKNLTDLNVSNNNLSGVIPKNLTTFPRSSFFPGNAGLIFPGTPQSSAGSGSGSGGGLKSSLKTGLIAGCTAAAVLVIGIGVVICCCRRFSKSYDSTAPALAIEGPQKSVEKAKQPVNLTAAGFEREIEHGASTAMPVLSTGKSNGSRKERSSPTKTSSLVAKLDSEIETGPANHHWVSSTKEDITMSPGHPSAAKVSPEHPSMDGTVPSSPEQPEQLVGDVFFLDKALAFSAEELSRAPAEVLGRSNHGTSYKAVLTPDHVLVVKWLKGELAKTRKEFGVEAKKFASIRHQNVVAMVGYYCGPLEHEKLIMSDFVIGQSLGNCLQGGGESSPPRLTWPQRLKVAVDVSRGLSYLHTRHRWVHGNIKPSNILLTEGPDFDARLSDYSLQRLMTPAGILNQVVESCALGYCAPELTDDVKKAKQSMKSDIYSFGVILLELVTGKRARDMMCPGARPVDLPDWVREKATEGRTIDCYDTALVGEKRDQVPSKGMEELLAMALSCTAPSSSTRPNMKVAHEHLAAISPA